MYVYPNLTILKPNNLNPETLSTLFRATEAWHGQGRASVAPRHREAAQVGDPPRIRTTPCDSPCYPRCISMFVILYKGYVNLCYSIV